MSAEPTNVLRLPPSRLAPTLARRALRDAAADLGRPDLIDSAVLLTSELVTNAVTHGTGYVMLAIDVDGDSLAVSVGDDNPDPPQVRPEQLYSAGGRGLRMVDRLASEWGVTQREDGPGKVVWFRLT